MSFPDPIQQSDAFIAYLRAENIDFCVRLFERYQARPPDLSNGRLDEANLVKWCEDICTLLGKVFFMSRAQSERQGLYSTLCEICSQDVAEVERQLEAQQTADAATERQREEDAPFQEKSKGGTGERGTRKGSTDDASDALPTVRAEASGLRRTGRTRLRPVLEAAQELQCHRDPDASTKEMPVSVAQSASRKRKARPSVDAHIARTISRSDNEAGPSTRSRGKQHAPLQAHPRIGHSKGSSFRHHTPDLALVKKSSKTDLRDVYRRLGDEHSALARTYKERLGDQHSLLRGHTRSWPTEWTDATYHYLLNCCELVTASSGIRHRASDVGRQLSDIGRLVSCVRRQALDISAGCDSPEETQAHYWNAEQSDGSYTQYGIVRPRSGGPGGQISTQSDKVFKAGGTVITQIWCRLGKTGTIGLLKCLHWKADQSGTGLAWKANMKRVERIFNAILEHPDLQGAKRSIPSGAAGPVKGA
ncbi:hypothetical protein BJV78DRAFT_1159009 [Lactifluus subvellereus]|nr:hypothetical protein BJV78DRAFT_1159009 [Lactifluus subvellereus]